MMNDCTIRIEVDGEKEVYKPGDTVTGTVHVEVNDDCQCDGLLLSLEWYTHGRGNTTWQRADRRLLFEGEWAAGEHHTYDFELTFPPGPYTYHGNYLNVDWRLKANADIPWALDPSAERTLQLEPSGTEEAFRVGDEEIAENNLLNTDDDQAISWGGVVFGAVFMGVGLFVGGAFLPSVPSLPFAVGVFLFSLIFIAAGGFMVYSSIRNYFAEKRLGDVNVQLESMEVSPGETIRARTTITPSGTVELNEVSVRLHGFEKVVSGSGTNRTTYTHTIHDEETPIQESRQATIRGGQRTFKTRVSIPDPAPYSFYASDNLLKWHVEVHIDIPWWPDWTHKKLMTVRPKIES